MGRLNEKVAVITGTSSGYGRTMAIRFAQEGAKVVCVDITTDIGHGFETTDDYKTATDELIRSNGGDAVFMKCDITNIEDVQKMFNEVDKKYGTIDILVNNAGIWRGGAFMHELSASLVQQSFNVNVFGTWNCCQEAIKRFIPKMKGKIVTMCSTAGVRPYPFQAPYNMSKGAVNLLIQTIANEYGPYQINSNGICPSFGKTPMNTSTLANKRFEKMVDDKNALGRWVNPQDVANLAVFLASDESDYVTGQLIMLDGGEYSYSVQDYAKAYGMT